jgi:glycosyltransferase involved in cell wall biosynthesis
LVAPESPVEFARALETLIADPARRRALGEAGRQRVNEKFGLEGNIARLAQRFGLGAAV